ncbi:hypothetical protein C5167_044949 [Papaver somniferum]|uniref:Uncharacterized protein n=1 Tax=Papaver somniferum TaxID=3469 RepID=A0A4Y7LBW2_PAPSO|nr:hypothetical protein C5167_044949 [Papaver somniferum]
MEGDIGVDKIGFQVDCFYALRRIEPSFIPYVVFVKQGLSSFVGIYLKCSFCDNNNYQHTFAIIQKIRICVVKAWSVIVRSFPSETNHLVINGSGVQKCLADEEMSRKV